MPIEIERLTLFLRWPVAFVAWIALVLSALILIAQISDLPRAIKYEQTQRCPLATPRPHCFVSTSATASMSTITNLLAGKVNQLTLDSGTWSRQTTILRWPWQSDRPRSGEDVLITVWEGKVTVVRVGSENVETLDNPLALYQLFERAAGAMLLIGVLFAIAPLFVWARLMQSQEEGLDQGNVSRSTWVGDRLASLAIRAFASTLAYLFVIYLVSITHNYIANLFVTLVATAVWIVPWVPYWRALSIEFRLPQSPKVLLSSVSSVSVLLPLWCILTAGERLVLAFGGA